MEGQASRSFLQKRTKKLLDLSKQVGAGWGWARGVAGGRSHSKDIGFLQGEKEGFLQEEELGFLQEKEELGFLQEEEEELGFLQEEQREFGFLQEEVGVFFGVGVSEGFGLGFGTGRAMSPAKKYLVKLRGSGWLSRPVSAWMAAGVETGRRRPDGVRGAVRAALVWSKSFLLLFFKKAVLGLRVGLYDAV